MLTSLNNCLIVASKCVVLTSSQDFQQVKRALIKLRLSNLKLEFISIPDSKFDKSTTMRGILHFSNAAALRLFASTSIDDSVDSIIYLDGDVMIRKPLDNNTFPNENFSAMIEQKPTREIHYVTNYFNSGVFITQLSFWRKNKCEEKLLQFLKDNPKSIYKDQDALNAVFSHLNLEPLATDLNYIVQDYNFIHNLFSNPKIVHFAGPLKPWKLTTPNSKFVNEWRILANELQLYPPRKIRLSDLILRFAYTLRIHILVRQLRKFFWQIVLKD